MGLRCSDLRGNQLLLHFVRTVFANVSLDRDRPREYKAPTSQFVRYEFTRAHLSQPRFRDKPFDSRVAFPPKGRNQCLSAGREADKWPPYNSSTAALKNSIDAWLQHLVRNGDLVKDTQQPPAAAMVITAKDPGAAGNSIKIVVSNVREDVANPPNKIFDVTVTETDTYTGLTPATIKDVLGTAAGGGQKPGLVFISSAAAPVLPAAGTNPLSTDPAKATINKADATPGAFDVTAKRGGVDGALTVVIIKDVVGQTFTLVAVWTKNANAMSPAAFSTQFAYEIVVSAPPGGGALLVPAPGTLVLAGGADAQGPTPASTVVPANP